MFDFFLSPLELYRRGIIKAGQRDYQGAILDLSKAIEGGIDLSDAFYVRGACKEEAGDHKGAVGDCLAGLRRAIVAMPQDSIYCYLLLAGALGRLGHGEESSYAVNALIYYFEFARSVGPLIDSKGEFMEKELEGVRVYYDTAKRGGLSMSKLKK